jgi:hypothetical protein
MVLMGWWCGMVLLLMVLVALVVFVVWNCVGGVGGAGGVGRVGGIHASAYLSAWLWCQVQRFANKFCSPFK